MTRPFRRVRFALDCTNETPLTPAASQHTAATQHHASPLIGTQLTYHGHMAHLAALVAPAVILNNDHESLDELLKAALPYASIPRLLPRLKPANAIAGQPLIGILAALNGNVVVWAGERWIAVSEFVVAAGIAATKLCGQPASARHKAVVLKEGDASYVLRLTNFPYGEQRGRFFVH